MDVRKKLIEILKQAPFEGKVLDEWWWEEKIKRIAEHLIRNGVTVQEWISVKDGLPEESGMYIVTAKDGHAQRVSFVLWQKKNRRWNLTGARSYWRVTHWQPMPQPPKGK